MIPTTSGNFIFLPAFLSNNHNGLRIHKSFTISQLIIQSKVSQSVSYVLRVFLQQEKNIPQEKILTRRNSRITFLDSSHRVCICLSMCECVKSNHSLPINPHSRLSSLTFHLLLTASYI